LKKPAGSVQFRFYKQKTRKTEPKSKKTGKKPSQNRENRAKTRKNRAKTEKTEPNRFEPVFSLKTRTETGQFDPVLVQFRFFFQKQILIWLFFYKNQTEPKMITPI
jgi:hypothetical protein